MTSSAVAIAKSIETSRGFDRERAKWNGVVKPEDCTKSDQDQAIGVTR